MKRTYCFSLQGFVVAATIALLAACGSPPPPNADDPDAATAALPRPERAGDSVTGMPPAPGPGDVPLAGAPPLADAAAAQLAIDLFNPESGALPDGATPVDAANPQQSTAEPTPADAVAVLREYYASIDGRSYARAYALWSDAGRASGQTPQQFADGFAQTAQVGVEIGAPGSEDTATGQRQLSVPVSVDARQADGSVRHYIGSYVLHRTVVDGTSAEQRAWRIASADLREVRP
ncbi:MAG: hypothetical protein ACREO8_05980 [Luteimonas sp.]